MIRDTGPGTSVTLLPHRTLRCSHPSQARNWWRTEMHRLEYVGRGDIREVSSRSPPGTPIRSREDLLTWLARNMDDDGGWRTFTVSLDGDLVIAPRRSEHVACAGGQDVLAAGEIRFAGDGTVAEVTNNSTGY